MKSIKKYQIAVLIFAVIAVPVSLGAFGTITHFGGEVTDVMYCTCVYDLAIVLTVDDLASGDSIKVKYGLWYSTLNMNYNIFKSGVNVIGGATSGFTTCLQQAGYYCEAEDEGADAVIDYVRGVGTSLN